MTLTESQKRAIYKYRETHFGCQSKYRNKEREQSEEFKKKQREYSHKYYVLHKDEINRKKREDRLLDKFYSQQF
jgi:hypothetical protein